MSGLSERIRHLRSKIPPPYDRFRSDVALADVLRDLMRAVADLELRTRAESEAAAEISTTGPITVIPNRYLLENPEY